MPRLNAQTLPSWVAVLLFVAMFAAGSFAYRGFFSGQVLLNLLIDNAFLLVVAIGMTFVILSGGIDLSVGSVVALTTMVLAWGVERAQLPPRMLADRMSVAAPCRLPVVMRRMKLGMSMPVGQAVMHGASWQ